MWFVSAKISFRFWFCLATKTFFWKCHAHQVAPTISIVVVLAVTTIDEVSGHNLARYGSEVSTIVTNDNRIIPNLIYISVNKYRITDFHSASPSSPTCLCHQRYQAYSRNMASASPAGRCVCKCYSSGSAPACCCLSCLALRHQPHKLLPLFTSFPDGLCNLA